MTRTRTRVWLVRLALVASVGLVGVVASGAFAAGHTRHLVRTGFSVFSHGLARAHKADAAGMSAPQGAVLADVIKADGITHELYAWHRTPQEVCLVDVEAGGGVTTACSPDSSAEAQGVSFIGGPQGVDRVNVAALVPDGVTTVRITEGNGSTQDVAVVNNVTEYAASDVTGFSYSMPSGSVVSHSAHASSESG
jgi:hypothetical protein